jgi:hypothetical protein
VSISGLNFQVIGGGNSSISFQIVKTTGNGVRIVFEGAKDAGEQHAGSTAASRFAPAAAAARSKRVLDALILCRWGKTS